ncbi:MAG: hypothetical protein OXH66_10045 [Gemmatimonadetes bacterium]|nr:hypothetical protein [Gemmatimonadota bacterium]
MKRLARRIVTWGPVAAIIAIIAREASHIHVHLTAPHTILACVAIPVLAGCACVWHRRRR